MQETLFYSIIIWDCDRSIYSEDSGLGSCQISMSDFFVCVLEIGFFFWNADIIL